MREKGKRRQITVPTPNCLVYHFPFAESLFQSIRGNLPTTACLSPRRESRKSSKLVRKSHSCGDKRQSSGQRQAGSCVSSFALGGASLCEAGWDQETSGSQRPCHSHCHRPRQLLPLKVEPARFRSIKEPLQCTMIPLSTRSCLKSNKLRPILNGQFFHAIFKNIGLNMLGSKQPREILVFVILKL